MIDLDAIKAASLNTAERSAELLALHKWRESVRLQDELCAKFLRDNPRTSSEAFAAFAERVAA